MLKQFIMFMIAFCSVFLVYGLMRGDYVSALIQLVCLLININTYRNIVARENKPKDPQ